MKERDETSRAELNDLRDHEDRVVARIKRRRSPAPSTFNPPFSAKWQPETTSRTSHSLVSLCRIKFKLSRLSDLSGSRAGRWQFRSLLYCPIALCGRVGVKDGNLRVRLGEQMEQAISSRSSRLLRLPLEMEIDYMPGVVREKLILNPILFPGFLLFFLLFPLVSSVFFPAVLDTCLS